MILTVVVSQITARSNPDDLYARKGPSSSGLDEDGPYRLGDACLVCNDVFCGENFYT